jgi:hypothetical protein
MKLTVFMLLAMFAPMLQPSARLQEEPDIEIQNFEWGTKIQTSFVLPGDSTAETSGHPEDRAPTISRSGSGRGSHRGEVGMGDITRQTVTRVQTSALVKNTGTRTTKVVEWEYIFLSDADDQKELKRYKFRNKIKIASGETKFLSKDVKDRAVSRRQKVQIVRIEYTDKSVWQRAVSKSEP